MADAAGDVSVRARGVVSAIELPPFDPLNRRAAALRAEGHHVISLGQAVPFFPPPDSALAAARRALDGADVHRYVTDPGLPGLRRARSSS
jgi:aspartate/methionine/tyrosine aminotransferase